MMKTPPPGALARRSFLPSVLLILASGCGGSGDSAPAGPGFAGALSVFEPDPTTLEAEPNDTLAQAHQLGNVSPNSEVAVIGSITELGSDQLDIFEFQAPERVAIDASFTWMTQGADLAFLVFDSVGLEVVEEAGTPGFADDVSFVAKGTFFIAVASVQGSADYELTLVGRPTGAFEESEPNDTLDRANYLGTLSIGESITVNADNAEPGLDAYLFSVPAGLTVSVRTTALDPGGDFDMTLLDVTDNGVGMPTFLEQFSGPGFVQNGQRGAKAMTLYALEVYPAPTGNPSAYVLEIANGVLSFQGASSGAPTRRPIAKRATARRAAPFKPDPERFSKVLDLPAPVLPGDVIVKFRGAAEPMTADTVNALALPMLVDDSQHLCKVRCEVGEGWTEEEVNRAALAVAATLRGMPDVEYAELDHRVQITALPQTEVFPNDTFFNLQWHYEQIGLPRAWAITTGSSAVRVAVLDTGTVAATDLRNAPGIDMISDLEIAGDGDGVDADPTDVGDGVGPQPSSFHGAHVAGTISASTNNDFGVAGVSWDATVFHVRVLGLGGGSSFDIAQGIRYAAGLSNTSGQVANPPADIINMSLGGPGFNQTVENACTAAHGAGVLVVAAAGNNDSPEPFYPAAYADVVSVSAVDFERRKAPYSNFHPTVDLAAPGGDVSADRNNDNRPDGVLSTKPDDGVFPINFDSFSFYQGTSMAAPHVAGVAALMLTLDSDLTPDEVEGILKVTATDLGTSGPDDIFGSGLVNAFGAVQMVNGGAGMTAPILSLATSSALFESRSGNLSVGVSNAGGGTLQVNSVIATTASPQNWLSGSAVSVGQTASSDTSSIEISVNAAGLPDGVYGGQLVVDSNGGSLTIAVTLALGQGGTNQTYEVFVIAVDAETLETVAQDVVSTGGSLNYSLEILEAGSYLLVAGTDEDLDDVICDAGEPLCGFYPSLGLSTTIVLDEGERITGLNFPLQPVEGSTASTGGPVFRLLDRGDEGGDR